MKKLFAIAVVLALTGSASANPHAMFRANFSAAVYAPPLVTYQQPQAIIVQQPPIVYQQPAAIIQQQQIQYQPAPVQFFQAPQVQYYSAAPVQFFSAPSYGSVSFFSAPATFSTFSRTTTITRGRGFR